LVGLIINPRSRANRRRPLDATALRARHPALLIASPADPAGLDAALAGFAAAGVRLLAISGGDGTLRDVLSAAPRAFAVMPEIAILADGNTNLAARALGSAGRGAGGLARLLAAHTAGRLRRRACPTLSIAWPDEPARPQLHGFLFGAAGFTEAKLMAEAELLRRGLHSGLAVATALVVALVAALTGRDGKLSRGTDMEVGADAETMQGGRHFLLLATTLDRLMLGLWPFWGAGHAAGAGGLNWLDIAAPPVRLGAALLAILWRRQPAWLAQRGYRSGRCERLRVQLDRPFILDGEAFEPRAGIVLEAGFTVSAVFP
jgi:diacylglycerol kinase family enzyme